jgi:ribosomal protein S18 acetylase RimI-like enzyme
MADFADDNDNLNPQAVIETPEADEADDDTIVQFEGEEEAAPASDEDSGTNLVRHLRQVEREKYKENRELRARLAALESTNLAPEAVDPGPKPTMADCGWDEEAFEQRLDDWKATQATANNAKAKASAAVEADQAAINIKMQAYQERKQTFKVAGFVESEAMVSDAMSPLQRALFLKHSGNPALVKALADRPAKLAELVKIAQPDDFAVAISKLEGSLKVTIGKRASAPESIVRGSASMAPNGADKHLARLEAEAAKTGSYTKVIAHKRSLRTA